MKPKKDNLCSIFSSVLFFLALSCAGPKNESAPSASTAGTEKAVTFSPQQDVVMELTEDNDMSRVKFTPMESIQDLDQRVSAYHLGQNLTPQQLEENAALKKKIIRGTFDIAELSRLSLDKHWDEITVEQRKHFVSLMTHLLEKKAIFSKEQLHGDNKLYDIHYTKETIEPADQTKATVYSKMLVPKKKMDLDLTYKLLRKPTGWKIYDVIVDDASLLSNYRFQFDRIIQKSGFADLIQRMEGKLTQIGEGS